MSRCAIDDTLENFSQPEQFDDKQVSEAAMKLMNNATSRRIQTGQPWFLAVGFRKPHLQWRFPLKFLAQYPENQLTLPKHRFWPEGTPEIGFHQPVDDFLEEFVDVQQCGGSIMSPGWAFPAACQVLWRRAYWSSVSFLDEQMGRVLDNLDRLGQTDNTIVVLFGDHGWQLGEWGEWEKFTNMEYATRVPLIFKLPPMWNSPEIRRGYVFDGLAELIDVYPTLVELATSVPPAANLNLEGVSFAPMLTGSGHDGKPYALSQFPRCCNNESLPLWKLNDCEDVPRNEFTHMGLSIRTTEWRYTKWYRWNRTALKPAWQNVVGEELYDHKGDIGTSFDGDFEAKNLVIDGRFADIVVQLSRALEKAFHQ